MYWYGEKTLLMRDSNLKEYVADITDNVRRYFNKEGRKPSLEEFAKHLNLLIEEDFVYMQEEGMNLIIYSGDKTLFIYEPNQFTMLLEEKYGIKNLYDEIYSK